jgi:hypothetical protein
VTSAAQTVRLDALTEGDAAALVKAAAAPAPSAVALPDEELAELLARAQAAPLPERRR